MARACQGRVALITGASRGIGAAIAERLAAEGAAVAIIARSLDTHPSHLPGTLVEVAERITKRGGRALPIRADLTDRAAPRRVVEQTVAALGPVEILVNNAAAAFYMPFERVTEKRYQILMDLNVRVPFELAQLVVPTMREMGRGWILNISSATAAHPQGPPYPTFDESVGTTLYGMSKAALERLTTGLAAETCACGIAVNSLAPVAAVLTPGVEALGVVPADVPGIIEPVELMAEAAVILASCDARHTTGRIFYSRPLLAEMGVQPRTLDGARPFVEG